MEKFLVQSFIVYDHPIKNLKEKFKVQYIKGIGEFLCYLTNNDSTTKLVFEVWSKSIIENIPKEAWSTTRDCAFIKKALAIHRDGLSIFDMRYSFLFDCFYLLEKSNKNLRRNAFIFLAEKVCGFFTKKKLNFAYDFFNGNNNGEKLPQMLINHRGNSQNFTKKQIKRVLIVATMSAGKSTLVNALVGHKINQVKATACTSRIHYIYNKPQQEGAFAYTSNKKLLYTEDYSSLATESIEAIGIKFESSLSKSRVCLIDTPGVNYNGDKSHGELTRKIIRDNQYDVVVLVMNAQQLAIEDERDLINYIGNHSKGRVIGILNQCDVFKASQDSITDALNTGRDMMMEAGIKNPLVIPISAYAAYLSKQSSILGKKMDEEDAFELERLSKKMQKTFFNLPAYLNGVPKDIKTTFLERTGLPYLEYVIRTL